ncbi:MAG: hypothetical protein K2H89_03500 [Oscillospiraceae bacterium]|nr:hypothetical protein [Oscillospiraceae bacterium]
MCYNTTQIDENSESFAKKTIIKEADGKKKCFWNLYDPKTKQFSIKGLQKQTAPLYHAQSLKHAELIFLQRAKKMQNCSKDGKKQLHVHQMA